MFSEKLGRILRVTIFTADYADGLEVPLLRYACNGMVGTLLISSEKVYKSSMAALRTFSELALSV